jgi:anti-anti-sigma factor
MEPAIQHVRLPGFVEGRVGGDPPKIFELSIVNPETGLPGERSGDVVRLPAEINERTVLINLNEMDHIDSWRIALLLEAMQRIKAHGGDLVFFGIRDDLRRFFERARLDQVFRIFSTREEALADQGRRPRRLDDDPALKSSDAST